MAFARFARDSIKNDFGKQAIAFGNKGRSLAFGRLGILSIDRIRE